MPSIRTYVLLNAVVWIVSLAMLLVVRSVLKDFTGFGLLSVALPIGFGVVSVFDYIYERLHAFRP